MPAKKLLSEHSSDYINSFADFFCLVVILSPETFAPGDKATMSPRIGEDDDDGEEEERVPGAVGGRRDDFFAL